MLFTDQRAAFPKHVVFRIMSYIFLAAQFNKHLLVTSTISSLDLKGVQCLL